MSNAAVNAGRKDQAAYLLPEPARKLVPGLIVALGLGFVANHLGTWAPVVGAPIFGILLGIGLRLLAGVDRNLMPGVGFASKTVLQLSIVILGGSLSLAQVWQIGKGSLDVMAVSLVAGLVTALALGRAMGVPWRMATLLGAGTSICGASAIAAVAPAVGAEEDEVAYSISAVFCFNIVAVFLFPFMGRALGLPDIAFGLWAGTAINDTSSVVAAGYSWSQAAGNYATVTKLARTFMIIPVSLGFATWTAYRRTAESRGRIKFRKTFPWFILGFLGMALLNSAGLIGGMEGAFGALGKFIITVALCAVGMGAEFAKMKAVGLRPLLLGFLTWVGVALVSIVQILLL